MRNKNAHHPQLVFAIDVFITCCAAHHQCKPHIVKNTLSVVEYRKQGDSPNSRDDVVIKVVHVLYVLHDITHHTCSVVSTFM